MKTLKIILSGGGTGGHIYPALSVADALKSTYGDGVEILFVGAEGKMEMERVPAYGYRIEGLPVAGLQRRLTLKNLSLPAKVMRSLGRAKEIIRDFGPDVVVGFGGYASGPVLWQAQRMGIPTLIQEQNSYAGLTNKILSKRASKICTAYDGMDRFFPADKIVKTGNPLRGSFADVDTKRGKGFDHFKLNPSKPVIMIVGGSLGTRTLNNAVLRYIDEIITDDKVQIIWQTGSYYINEITAKMADKAAPNVWFGPFIERMDLAYAMADVVISRAGACTVSELSLVGRPVIFVPSPNVAEDHQTKNAEALVAENAAIMIADVDAVEKVVPQAVVLSRDTARCAELSANIKKLGIPDSADRIVREIVAISGCL